MTFTVKVEYEKGSHQFWQTPHIYVFEPDEGKPYSHRKVTFVEAGGVHVELTHGRVFIMNERGQTVQQYHLECDKLPEGVSVPPVADAA